MGMHQHCRLVLQGPLFQRYFEKVEVSNFEVASDAFSTFKVLSVKSSRFNRLLRSCGPYAIKVSQEHCTDADSNGLQVLQGQHHVAYPADCMTLVLAAAYLKNCTCPAGCLDEAQGYGS